jgi:small neutral amino acid transporter SnatA (MarC family)
MHFDALHRFLLYLLIAFLQAALIQLLDIKTGAFVIEGPLDCLIIGVKLVLPVLIVHRAFVDQSISTPPPKV